jgi:hypothetical protein
MNKPVWYLLPTLCWWLASGVVQADGLADAFQQGRAAAAGGAAASGTINAGSATNTVPGYTTNPQQAGLYGDGKQDLSDHGLGKQAGCTTADTTGFAGKECDAINFLSGGRPQYPLEKHDALFNLSKSVTKDTRDGLAGLGSGNGTGGCTKVVTTSPDLESVEHCEEWLKTEDKRCAIGRVVKVDKDVNYQCEVTSAQKAQHDCHKTLTVTCQTQGDGCAASGIQLGSVSGDMQWASSTAGGNTLLTLGTVGNDYWGSGVYDRSSSFNISKLTDVSLFKIDHAWFDDWLWVQVNGISVYVGPYGGDKLDYRNECAGLGDNGECLWYSPRVYYTASASGNPELGTSWDKALDINIKPYLREGNNTIWMRTVVAGWGESAIRMVTRQYCPPVCNDSWVDGCTGYAL